jgi:hypothetical protein
MRPWLTRACALHLALIAAAMAVPATGQQSPPFSLINARLQQRANGAVTLMSYTVTPDASASSLSIDSAETGNPSITLWQLGYGFPLAASFPLYLEGFGGYSRYDPTFVASNGEEERKIPVKWTTLAATGGIGWDFPLFWDLTFRPIFNFSIGHVESDLSLLGRFIEFASDKDINFLDGGRLNAYGLGGSAMLVYWRYREFYDVEVDLRYTYLHLQSFDSTSGVVGTADAQTASLWSRLRFPTGLVVFRRPFRGVLEYTNTTYLGDQRGVLGFNYLNQFGLGIEIDTSAYHTVLTRVRFVARYVIGENVSGVGAGLAVTLF